MATMRATAGVAGIADTANTSAQVAATGTSGRSAGYRSYLDPSAPSFWVLVISLACVVYLFGIHKTFSNAGRAL